MKSKWPRYQVVATTHCDIVVLVIHSYPRVFGLSFGKLNQPFYGYIMGMGYVRWEYHELHMRFGFVQ